MFELFASVWADFVPSGEFPEVQGGMEASGVGVSVRGFQGIGAGDENGLTQIQRNTVRLLNDGNCRLRSTMVSTPIHPGEILRDELKVVGLSAKKLADAIEVPPNRLYQLLGGKRNVTPDTARRLGLYFGMSAGFWMNLQSAYELDVARAQVGKDLTEP